MAVVAVNSSLMANVYATPSIPNPSYSDGSRANKQVAVVNVGLTDSAGSIYRMVRVNSNDLATDILINNQALGTGGLMGVGLYRTVPDGGQVVNATLFAAALSVATAVLTPVNVRFNTLTAATTAQRIWELLGLSADPQLAYDLCLTYTPGTPAAGAVGLIYWNTR